MKKVDKYGAWDDIHLYLKNLTQEIGTSAVPAPGCEPGMQHILKFVADYLSDSFFWVTNIREQEITWMAGVEKHLGLACQSFDLARSIELVHPDFRDIRNYYATLLYPSSLNLFSRYPQAVLEYKIQFPMRDVNGNYYMVSQYSRAYELDEEGRLISNLNYFRKEHIYQGQVPKIGMRLRCLSGNYLIKECMLSLKEEIVDWLLRTRKLLTEREWQILKMVDLQYKSSEISQSLGINKETVKKHRKNILRKARQQFPSIEPTMEKIIDLYGELGLLGY